MDERSYWIAFSVFPGIGPVRFKLLNEYFGSAKNAWEAKTKEWEQLNLPPRLLREFLHFRRTFSIPAYITKLREGHVSVLTLSDKKYPKLLKEISDAPFVLYVKSTRGSEKIDMERTIAVVGTRKASPYGITATEKIVTDLTLSGIVIVSGMAYGIDAAAHHAAISAGGKTIAVLGCGVDIIAPSVNADIYKKLTEEGYGAVISEMPLGLRPSKGLFPSRNRIISGLSRGVVVVEGASDSGALITARYAAEQGRDVFAVPGPITSSGSQASSLLLRQGAILTENADDVVSQLGIAKSGKPSHNTKRVEWQSKDEEKVGDALSRGPLHIDELVAATGLTINTISSTLTLLEVKGIVKDTGGKVYQLL